MKDAMRVEAKAIQTFPASIDGATSSPSPADY